jgi:DNA-directed RNA polymerase specialized sigma24 family protein
LRPEGLFSNIIALRVPPILSSISEFFLLNSSDFSSEHTSYSTVGNKTGSPKAKWSLTQAAFDKLLSCFSSNREEAGTQYELTRRKLVRFFEWRAVELAEDHADETLNRVARRIDEGQAIDNLQRYVYGVARIVFKEIIKQQKRAPIALEDAPQTLHLRAPEQQDETDRRLICFDRCFDSLSPENRQLILDYYQEERGAKIQLRQQLADRMHIQLNALRIRAHRIRMSLEACISACLQGEEKAE